MRLFGRKTLVKGVEKRENSPYGAFVNIMNDLGTFVEGRSADEIEPELMMAYAYARRAVSAALYVQGIFDRGEYSYQEMTFQNTQQMLARQSKKCQTKEFQEAAAFEALALLQSYDDRLTRNTVGRIVSAVLTRISDPDEVSAKDVGSLLQPDDVYSWLERTQLLERLERNELNIIGLSEIEKLIDADGIDHTTTRFAEILSEMLATEEIAYQFILEEIEAASQGTEDAKKFARNSGIEPWAYEGAMQNSRPEVDGEDGPQHTLVALSLQLFSNPKLMLSFRTMIVDKIMKEFELGKYSPEN